MKFTKSLLSAALSLLVSSCSFRSQFAPLIQEGYSYCKSHILDVNQITEEEYKDRSVDYVLFYESGLNGEENTVVAYCIDYSIHQTKDTDYYFYREDQINRLTNVSYSRYALVYNSVKSKSQKGEIGSLK